MIGSSDGTMLRTVFGEKPQIYCDYTASGKALKFIEDYMQSHIMPLYANSHSMHSATGKQTVFYREESRAIIKKVCNANDQDALIFAGTGATFGINLMVSKLRVKELSQEFEWRQRLGQKAAALARKVLA